MEFNAEVAMEQYRKRVEDHKNDKHVNNADLHAGSPMYFYCPKCRDIRAVLSEGYTSSPPRHCTPCEVLVEHGLI